MWNSGSVNLGLNEAFSLWLSVLLVMLLSSLMMVMLFVLVSRFLLGLSLLTNKTLNMGLDHVLDLTIGQSLGA